MIASICGKLIEKNSNSLLIDINGVVYRVYVSDSTLKRLYQNINPDGTIHLVTYHYFHVEPSRSIPMLIGFLNDIEREFFEIFITVSGIGPRGALKALNKPISSIAHAIYEADIEFLKSLPGIGEQRAREIVAKLQSKVGKFGLVRDEKIKTEEIKKDVIDEVTNVLIQLQYKKQEAMAMIKKALERNPNIQNAEDLLNEIYRQRAGDVRE